MSRAHVRLIRRGLKHLASGTGTGTGAASPYVCHAVCLADGGAVIPRTNTAREIVRRIRDDVLRAHAYATSAIYSWQILRPAPSFTVGGLTNVLRRESECAIPAQEASTDHMFELRKLYIEHILIPYFERHDGAGNPLPKKETSNG